jgi:hypothetical protein
MAERWSKATLDCTREIGEHLRDEQHVTCSPILFADIIEKYIAESSKAKEGQAAPTNAAIQNTLVEFAQFHAWSSQEIRDVETYGRLCARAEQTGQAQEAPRCPTCKSEYREDRGTLNSEPLARCNNSWHEAQEAPKEAK